MLSPRLGVGNTKIKKKRQSPRCTLMVQYEQDILRGNRSRKDHLSLDDNT